MRTEGYIIEWSTDKVTWHRAGTTSANARSYTFPTSPVTGPPANTRIYVKVTPFNANGPYDVSNIVDGIVTDTQRIDIDRLLFAFIGEETRVEAVDVDRLTLEVLCDETRVEAVDVDRLLLTVIGDETYP